MTLIPEIHLRDVSVPSDVASASIYSEFQYQVKDGILKLDPTLHHIARAFFGNEERPQNILVGNFTSLFNIAKLGLNPLIEGEIVQFDRDYLVEYALTLESLGFNYRLLPILSVIMTHGLDDPSPRLANCNGGMQIDDFYLTEDLLMGSTPSEISSLDFPLN